MKRILALIVLASLFLASCAQNTNCPAYGRTKADFPKPKRL